ncbi:hypothetical protein, partial [Faecalibaculum rodentium]|uniref:hypothetical protein n=1 Tax=Faecalibaculum rodentium TaxID=1702221 RepID=UPI0025A4F597
MITKKAGTHIPAFPRFGALTVFASSIVTEFCGSRVHAVHIRILTQLPARTIQRSRPQERDFLDF